MVYRSHNFELNASMICPELRNQRGQNDIRGWYDAWNGHHIVDHRLRLATCRKNLCRQAVQLSIPVTQVGSDKRFPCPIAQCNKTFTQQESANEHAKEMPSELREEFPGPVANCKKTFTRQKSAGAHAKAKIHMFQIATLFLIA